MATRILFYLSSPTIFILTILGLFLDAPALVAIALIGLLVKSDIVETKLIERIEFTEEYVEVLEDVLGGEEVSEKV